MEVDKFRDTEAVYENNGSVAAGWGLVEGMYDWMDSRYESGTVNDWTRGVGCKPDESWAGAIDGWAV